LKFHCTQHYHKKTKKHKRKRLICNIKINALNGIWFSQALLDIPTICRLICYVIIMNTPRQKFLKKKFNISSKIAVDWVNFCREVLNSYNFITSYGLIIEIDEDKFGSRKYNRKRLITGQWLFGRMFVERHTKKMFVVPVVSRKAEILLPLIKKYIAPGSTIYSDCWKAYDKIDQKLYKHYTVNHSNNFV
ncbi:Uncharacterized transposase-like protein HI1328.1, partial [Harpegnathos saltator]